MDAVNDWILYRAQAVDFRIDIFSALETPGTYCLRDGYDGGDGMHLTGAGYARVADLIYRNVDW